MAPLPQARDSFAGMRLAVWDEKLSASDRAITAEVLALAHRCDIVARYVLIINSTPERSFAPT
jgi:hypothetical protein